ncbi:MAG: hypothetical protein IPI50_11150 [Saprospiraceae bacterium]|nr:hypothetical protein [Saprospiraceae bacterium]
MYKVSLLVLVIAVLTSCQKNIIDDNPRVNFGEICDLKLDILSPEGFVINAISEINFNGNVREFQFVTEQIGFALCRKNVGGYVEVFKTTDGGQTWKNLNVGINQHPYSMVFKDENFGIITVLDVTGCPPPNCLHKCVILKTEDGGLNWKEIEFKELKGLLYNPKYDNVGNLYANLYLDTISLMMKSIDNGAHWDTLFAPNELGFSLKSSFEIFQNKIFVLGKVGKIHVIETNGKFIKTIETNNSTIWDLKIMDEDNIIVVSDKVLKSTNGGETWETIYGNSARLIDFDSDGKGLMILEKSFCPNDVYQVNDLIASTKNNGLNWLEAEKTTTNLRINFSNSQKMGEGIWFLMIENKLLELKEN